MESRTDCAIVCVDGGIQSESREQRGNDEGEERETERQSDYF